MNIKVEPKIHLATFNPDNFKFADTDVMILPEFKYIENPAKKYKLLYYTGTGTMEDNYIDRGFIAESNNSEEISRLATHLYLAFNSEEDIKNTWAYHHFKIESK